MDSLQTCCFTGHRPEVLYSFGQDEETFFSLILRAVEDAVADGYRLFLCGASRGGDMLFGEAVDALKEKYPWVVLECVLPCRDQAEGWDASDRRRYADLLDAADSVICLSDTYTRGCMHTRNRYMVDRSSLLIATYYADQKGGTDYTVKYAKKRGLRVVNLVARPQAPSQQLSFE